jgi:hypothetical protein
MDRLEVLAKDGLQVAVFDPSGELVDPCPEPADLERLKHHDPQQAQTRQD